MSIKISRHLKNPIIKTTDVKPSRLDFHVDGAFNAGVTEYKGETILLLRVAESVKTDNELEVKLPFLEKNKDNKYSLTVKTLHKENDAHLYDFSDSRVILNRKDNPKTVYLTSLSHLRIARSTDGVHFEVEDKPFIFPEGKYETWGIEDPRITKMEDWYYINYTAVSKLGAATALIRTRDFIDYERMGIIFPPENKDVSIFPEKINGKYIAYHRPVPKAFGNPDIWIATSDDLLTWGNHQHLLSVAEDDNWENGRIGGGAPSFKTEKGWVHIYHAADKDHRYCLGAFITDLNDPSNIIAKTSKPILEPTADYEKYGFFGQVVFTCGVTVKENHVKIYYGASDEVMALAEITIDELYVALGLEDEEE
ncbi:glycoside hydrolase family 130 protein [Alkalihalobacillus sp. 1P02AB]|uniref:glycoside hydrolase family 130 protein n=1 Tax=Alkalihalobacillus sp. 1P02AB TaxID=3132260 RepID=UPI0039A54B97